MSEFSTRQSLLQKLQNQYDADAWGEFIEIYQSFIFAVIRKMGVDLHDAEDITQKVLLQAWKVLPEYDYDRSKGRFRSWLTTITRNLARDEMRSKFRQFDNASTVRHQQLADLLDSWTDPEIERISEIEWQKYIVNKAWANVEPTLTADAQQTYQYLLQGRDIKDIAKELGLEKHTVYHYRTRIEKLLQQEIQRLELQLG